MNDAINRLVAMIAARAENSEQMPSMRDAQLWLLQQGLSAREIEEALDQLFHLLYGRKVTVKVRPHGQAPRHFSPFEEAKLSNHARETITRLESTEMISGLERELLIERLMQSDFDNDMEMLDYMLSNVIGSRRNVESQNTLINTLEGFGPTFH